MRLFTLTFAAGMVAFSIQAKTIQLTMQHMEQPPSRVEAMQVVVDKFIEIYPQYRLKQNVVGWGEAYSRVTAQVEAGVGVDLQQAIPAFHSNQKNRWCSTCNWSIQQSCERSEIY